MSRYILQTDYAGQAKEQEFKSLKAAEQMFGIYRADAKTFSVEIWELPDDEDKEPRIVDSFERE
jgi:hypothetical protein